MRVLPALVAISLSGIGIVWKPFESTQYPYTISQPSSFRHVTIQNVAGRYVDYFFPSLGSSVTNLNIYAVPNESPLWEGARLRGLGGQAIRRSGQVKPAGMSLSLVCGTFRSLGTKYTVEGVSFSAGGMAWYISASYEQKYKKLRPLLIKMINSFRLHLPNPSRRG